MNRRAVLFRADNFDPIAIGEEGDRRVSLAERDEIAPCHFELACFQSFALGDAQHGLRFDAGFDQGIGVAQAVDRQFHTVPPGHMNETTQRRFCAAGVGGSTRCLRMRCSGLAPVGLATKVTSCVRS